MPDAEKLMGLVMMGESLLEKMLLKRLLVRVAELAVLGVTIAVAVAALVIFGLFVAYKLMLEHGVNADTGLLIVGSVGVVIIMSLCALAVRRLYALRAAFKPRCDIAAKIGDTAEAFVSGLLTPSALGD